MANFDTLRRKAEAKAKDLRAKAEIYVDENRDKIDGGLDKAGQFVGRKTGKAQQADKAVGRVKGLLDRNPATDGRPGDTQAPPAR